MDESKTILVAGAGPYGFRLSGGSEGHLKVSKLRARSQVARAGLCEGDVVLVLNGESCENMSCEKAAELLETAASLHLVALPKTVELSGVSRAFQQNNIKRLKSSASEQVSSTTECRPDAVISNEDMSICYQEDVKPNKFEMPPENSNSLQLRYKEEVIVYRHVPNLPIADPPVLQKPANVPPLPGLDVMQCPPAGVDANVDSAFDEGRITPTGSATALSLMIHPTDTQDNSLAVNKLADSMLSKNALGVTQANTTPWKWSPSKTYAIKSEPLEEFQLEPVDISEEILARHEIKRNGKEEVKGEEDDLPQNIVKVLTSVENPNAFFFKKKNTYSDSSFYDDPQHVYPTIEEQIKMARKVAKSLTAPLNIKTRGQKMFLRRQERSKFWNIDNPAYQKEMEKMDVYYRPSPWNASNGTEENGSLSWKKSSKKSRNVSYVKHANTAKTSKALEILNAPKSFFKKRPSGGKVAFIDEKELPNKERKDVKLFVESSQMANDTRFQIEKSNFSFKRPLKDWNNNVKIPEVQVQNTQQVCKLDTIIAELNGGKIISPWAASNISSENSSQNQLKQPTNLSKTKSKSYSGLENAGKENLFQSMMKSQKVYKPVRFKISSNIGLKASAIPAAVKNLDETGLQEMQTPMPATDF